MGLLYSALRGLLRLGLRAYFQEVEVAGRENIPAGGPCVIVANHHNSMMDPFLIIAACERPLAFIAKAPLFSAPLLGAALRGLGCIPAHRSQDPGFAKEKNRDLYEVAARTLASGRMLAIFPEGKSHSDPHLAEFRHGASRIALEAETLRGGVRIQSVGIHFEETRGFRGKPLLQFGPALPLEDWKGRYAEDPRAATAALTDELRARLSEMILSAESHEILRLAELVRKMDVLDRGRPEDLKEEFDRRKFILDTYRDLRERVPLEVEALRTDLARYQQTLDLLGVRDDQVAHDYRLGRVLGRALGRTLALALGMPFVAVGLACNLLPYLLSRTVANLFSGTADRKAGTAFMTALLAFPLAWTALGYAGGRLGGWPGAGAAVAAAILTGALALRWMDALHRLLREAWGLWAAVALPGARATLRRLRARALGRVERLAAMKGPAGP